MSLKEHLVKSIDEDEIKIVRIEDNISVISISDSSYKYREDNTINPNCLEIANYNIEDYDSKARMEELAKMFSYLKYKIIGSTKHSRYDLDFNVIDCETKEEEVENET